MFNVMALNYQLCTEITHNKIIPLEENKCILVVKNPEQRHVKKIKVDGCLLPVDVEKCDWLVTTELPTKKAIFVELKGCDVGKAVSQLKSTLTKTKPTFDEYRKMCHVVSTKSPLSSSEIQKIQIHMRKKHDAGFKVETIRGSVDIEKL